MRWGGVLVEARYLLYLRSTANRCIIVRRWIRVYDCGSHDLSVGANSLLQCDVFFCFIDTYLFKLLPSSTRVVSQMRLVSRIFFSPRRFSCCTGFLDFIYCLRGSDGSVICICVDKLTQVITLLQKKKKKKCATSAWSKIHIKQQKFIRVYFLISSHLWKYKSYRHNHKIICNANPSLWM